MLLLWVVVVQRVRVSGLIVVITELRDTRKCRNNVTEHSIPTRTGTVSARRPLTRIQ